MVRTGAAEMAETGDGRVGMSMFCVVERGAVGGGTGSEGVAAGFAAAWIALVSPPRICNSTVLYERHIEHFNPSQ